MVPDGPKGVSVRLDDPDWPSLDSLGFGLAWDDPQAQRSTSPGSARTVDQEALRKGGGNPAVS